MAFIMALLAVGVGLAIKKWREDRKQRADEEYERRRWGQESALEVPTLHPALLISVLCISCMLMTQDFFILDSIVSMRNRPSIMALEHRFPDYLTHTHNGTWLVMQVSYAQSPLEAKEYNMALARTRQAMAVHRAIQYMNFGSPARYKSAFLPLVQCLWSLA